jgi:glycogen debranching enzyme
MDTIRRGPRAVDVQALYFGALNSAARMLALLGQKGLSAEAGEKAASLEKKFDSGFYSSGFYSDVLTDSGRVKTRTANALVPLLFGLGRHSREILRCIESGAFTTPVGVRTRAEGEDGFSPSGYHSGMAWSLTTAWASAAEFAAGRAEQGWGYMKILLDDANRDALGCIGECWDSRQHVQKGCGLQLWGSGFVPRLVDEFMLGLRINAMEKTIEASPALPRCVGMIERKRRIGGKEVSIRFEKRQGKVRAECSDKSFALVLH